MRKDLKEQFEAVAIPHIDAVYRAALALCNRHDEAADLVQTTYLKAFEGFRSFAAGTNCKAWLMRILRNTWIDQLRRMQLVKFVPLDEQCSTGVSVAAATILPVSESEEQQQQDRAETALEHMGKMPMPRQDIGETRTGETPVLQAVLESFSDQRVIDALRQLPADQRLALLLVDVEQMDHRDVAAVLDVPVGTIKSRTSRARAALKEKLLAHARDLGFVKR